MTFTFSWFVTHLRPGVMQHPRGLHSSLGPWSGKCWADLVPEFRPCSLSRLQKGALSPGGTSSGSLQGWSPALCPSAARTSAVGDYPLGWALCLKVIGLFRPETGRYFRSGGQPCLPGRAPALLSCQVLFPLTCFLPQQVLFQRGVPAWTLEWTFLFLPKVFFSLVSDSPQSCSGAAFA